MRRRRIIRKESQSSLLGSALLAALAGFGIGVFLMHKTGGIGPAIQKLRDRLNLKDPDKTDDDGPPDSVYHMNRFVHDDGDYGVIDDDITTDPDEDEAASEVETRVLAAFLNDPVLATAPVEISGESDGVVELRGWVENRRELQHAATIAGGVPGVVGVANNIRVRRPSRKRTS